MKRLLYDILAAIFMAIASWLLFFIFTALGYFLLGMVAFYLLLPASLIFLIIKYYKYCSVLTADWNAVSIFFNLFLIFFQGMMLIKIDSDIESYELKMFVLFSVCSLLVVINRLILQWGFVLFGASTKEKTGFEEHFEN